MAKKILFRVFAVLLVLLVFEVAFRALVRRPVSRLCQARGEVYSWCEPLENLVDHGGWYSPPPGTVYEHIYPSDPRGYFRPGAVVEYRMNAEGFRGPSIQENGQRHRLAFVGDSFTFGEGVHYEDTFVARLEKLLAPRVSDERGLQTLDLGQPGHNPYMELKLLEAMAPQIHAEMIVLVMTPNDSPSPMIAEVHGVDIRGEYVSLFDDSLLYGSSRLLWFFDNRWRRFQLNRKLNLAFDQVRDILPKDTESAEVLRLVMAQIREVAQQNGAKLAIVMLPEMARLSADSYPYAAIHETVSGFGKAENIQVIDLLPDFLGRDPVELWVHPVDHHPNERAHEIIAARLARDLQAPFLQSGAK